MSPPSLIGARNATSACMNAVGVDWVNPRERSPQEAEGSHGFNTFARVWALMIFHSSGFRQLVDAVNRLPTTAEHPCHMMMFQGSTVHMSCASMPLGQHKTSDRNGFSYCCKLCTELQTSTLALLRAIADFSATPGRTKLPF
eukprot:4411228-Amphidinium_carterae.3